LLNSDTAMFWIDTIFLFLDCVVSKLVQFISYGLILKQCCMPSISMVVCICVEDWFGVVLLVVN
jgi:hypothetical protein